MTETYGIEYKWTDKVKKIQNWFYIIVRVLVDMEVVGLLYMVLSDCLWLHLEEKEGRDFVVYICSSWCSCFICGPNQAFCQFAVKLTSDTFSWYWYYQHRLLRPTPTCRIFSWKLPVHSWEMFCFDWSSYRNHSDFQNTRSLRFVVLRDSLRLCLCIHSRMFGLHRRSRMTIVL